MMSSLTGYLGGVIVRTAWQLWQVFGFVFATAYLMQLVGKMIRRSGLGIMGRGYWYFVAPGVACHETGHAAGCIITGLKITEFVPFRIEGDTLGYVVHERRSGWTGAISDFVVATGPIWFGSIVIMLLTKLMAGEVAVGRWSEYFEEESVPGVIEYARIAFLAALDCVKGAAATGDFASVLFWVWLYLVFCIASEIGLSDVDISHMWGGIALIVFAVFALNVIPPIGNAATIATTKIMPGLFRIHVLMLAALVINLAIALIAWLAGRFR